MSHTKRALDDAAETLGVPVDELTRYVLNDGSVPTRPPRRFPAEWPRDTPPVPGDAVGSRTYLAAAFLDVHPADLAAWMRERERRTGDTYGSPPRAEREPSADIVAAASLLGVPVNVLHDRMTGDYTRMGPNRRRAAGLPAPAAVGARAAWLLNVDAFELISWQRTLKRLKREPQLVRAERERFARADVLRGIGEFQRDYPPGEVPAIPGSVTIVGPVEEVTVRPELVSEDDLRGVVADVVAAWAHDELTPAEAMGYLRCATEGMRVTTPSQRKLAAVRVVAQRAFDGASAYATEILDALDGKA